MEQNSKLKNIFNSSKYVCNYDLKAKKSNWYAPEIGFGLVFNYINAGESILDIGIGTGLSSRLFAKAGLDVYGIDFSGTMLEECRKKQFTTELKKHDLQKTPYPFSDAAMDHAICIGVLHLMDDLYMVFKETERILRSGGIFLFSVIDRDESAKQKKELKSSEKEKFFVHHHSLKQITALLEACGFSLLHNLKFQAIHAGRETVFRMYAAQKRLSNRVG